MPILRQLFTRDLLKGVGEQRISNSDLKGAQAVVLSLNENQDYSAARLKQLRSYLKNIVSKSLDYVGAYGLPEQTLERAAMLGIDVKNIDGKNGFYSPYLKDKKYAVPNQPVPSYSKEYINQLRDDRIFGYVKERGVAGSSGDYILIDVDASGKPIRNPTTKEFQTISIPDSPNWQTNVPTNILNFNRNFLLKTYNLSR